MAQIAPVDRVLFGGKDARVALAADSPKKTTRGNDALALPLFTSDGEPTTVASISRHPPPAVTALRPRKHETAEAALASKHATLVRAPSPTYQSSDLTTFVVTHPVRGRGAARRGDTHIWKFPDPPDRNADDGDSLAEPLYASTKRCVAAQSTCAKIRKRRSHSAPPRPLTAPPVDPGRPAAVSPVQRRPRSSSCRPLPRPLASYL